MSVQSLLNEYNKRQGVIESNESMLNECISSLVSLKQNLTPEIVEVVNKYNPNLLDLLDEEKFKDIKNVEEFKRTLDYVIDSLCTTVEGMLY
ncbi:MAG: hypothetical protein ACLR3R_20100 [Clostridium paraputrificum]